MRGGGTTIEMIGPSHGVGRPGDSARAIGGGSLAGRETETDSRVALGGESGAQAACRLSRLPAEPGRRNPGTFIAIHQGQPGGETWAAGPDARVGRHLEASLALHSPTLTGHHIDQRRHAARHGVRLRSQGRLLAGGVAAFPRVDLPPEESATHGRRCVRTGGRSPFARARFHARLFACLAFSSPVSRSAGFAGTGSGGFFRADGGPTSAGLSCA